MRIKVPVALFSCLLAAAVVFADEPQKVEPSAEEKVAMEAAMKAATPGDAHKKLNDMVGDFSTKATMWMAPGAPPMTSTGKSHNTWALDGRWVEQRYSGMFMGQPFKGVGYTGYDNIKKMYVGTWMDTMSTSVMTSTGTRGDDGRYTFNSSMDDPVSGKTMPVKEVVTVTDKDHHMLEMWMPDPAGQMFKMMEISYTRVKK
ncbi:MAG: hypothetical protein QOI24_2524 [Acidobacteriota bacterium]|jgi:hypothetical protein|nr:hypothetical protein [Acidobacteriota bacterium]